jgi:hypothetical protein
MSNTNTADLIEAARQSADVYFSEGHKCPPPKREIRASWRAHVAHEGLKRARGFETYCRAFQAQIDFLQNPIE